MRDRAFRAMINGGSIADVNGRIAYAQVIGIEVDEQPAGPVTVLRHRASNIGNHLIPALHGGVVGAFLEHAAYLHVLWENREALARGQGRVPLTINMTIDYLRPCGPFDTFARCTMVKQGRRIANLRVEAWQKAPDKLVASAHGHFLVA